MTNQDIIGRIKYLIKELGLTQGEFAEKIECDQSNLSKHLNGKLPISESLLNKIVINMGVSKAWLKEGTDVPFAKYSSGAVPSLIIDESELKSMKGTPVYDIDVTAGGMNRSMMFADEHIVGAVNMPNISPDCRIVRVSGDSMSPVICNGDFIAVRELSNMSQIFWGQIYVVVLDDYRMVKYLRKHSDADKVILRSENPRYDDMEVSRSEIRELLVVQNILHIDSRL
ncbi:MAG: LexA family transcriptional regulator [Muribaculaceae bacterium]|nr:LexA family transcriptional regulator [Muribaculaceae bacterium]